MDANSFVRLEKSPPNADNLLRALRSERELKRDLQKENKALKHRLDKATQELTAIRFAVHELRDQATCLAEVQEVLQRAEIYRPGLFEM